MKSALPAFALALALASCGDEATTPTPSDSPSPAPAPNDVTPILRHGPLAISFLNATIAPGSVVTGCGPTISGCAGRLRATFAIRSPVGGSALFMRAYLYGTNQMACLWGEIPGFAIPAGQTLPVEVLFDRADACGTPLTIRAMAANVEGTIEIATRQEWTIQYQFLP